jgi:general nucleoside transport system permease protein
MSGRMTTIVETRAGPRSGDDQWRLLAEKIVIPLAALVASALLFSLFLLALGKSPIDFFSLVWTGGFGTSFSLQNTLQRSAPFILTGLACAIPVQIGLLLIGAEGASVIGGFAAAAIAVPLINAGMPPLYTMPLMVLTAMIVGAIWVGIAGWLRHARSVNETISSLLLTYIAIAITFFFVEGLLRHPGSANKPSTMPIGKDYMVGSMPGTDVHWGFLVGIVLAIALHVLMSRTVFGFAARVTGGNARAARAQGLPVGKLILICSLISGACAGLAGYFEVAAIHGQANASLVAGYGYTGILVSFLARHNPIAIIPVAIFFGAIQASGGVIQRRMDLPDATVLVLQGIMFVVVLASETLQGRFAIFRPKAEVERT